MNKKVDVKGIGKKTGFGAALFIFASILYFALGKVGIKFLNYQKILLIIAALYIVYLVKGKWKK